MYFGTNVRYLRKQKEYSQDDIADKLCYKSFTTIQKWESGISEPNMKIVQKVAHIFSVSVEDLINKDLKNTISGGLDKLFKDISGTESFFLTEEEYRLIKRYRKSKSDVPTASIIAP